MRSLLRTGVVAALALAVLSPGAAGALSGAPAAADPPARRVLMLSLPTLTWDDVHRGRLPHLEALLRRSAVGALTLRSVTRRTDPGDGYATIGAGTRTEGISDVAGQNLQPAEPYGSDTAGQTFARRSGVPLPAGSIGALGFAPIVDANAGLLYDSEPGALGQRLTQAGVRAGVVANADEGELAPEADRYHREAALALVDQRGIVASGTVDGTLLRRDPSAPWGLRLDQSATLGAFDRVWRGRSVVLVEASDLARADTYRRVQTPEERAVSRRAALRATDRLVGRIMQRVDLSRDVVITFGPYHSARARQLAVTSLAGPGVEPGLLRSPTTRRDGIVSIQDVAPTVLSALHLSAPESMEGRPYRVGGTGGSFADRVDLLRRYDRDSVFRDQQIGTAMVALAVTCIVLAFLAAIALHLRRRGMLPTLAWLALSVPGLMVATALTATLPVATWGPGVYWAAVVGFALVFGAITLALGRIDWRLPVIAALAALVAVHLLDGLIGNPLELNTVFGYSPTVGIRVAGYGNPGSAQLCAGALALATMLAAVIPGRRGVWVSGALLAVVLVVVAAPFLGQDFGGGLSGAPAYLLFIWLVAGRKVTVKAVALLGAALLAAGLLVGFVDLLRPADSRTHVGRFFQKVGDEGPSGFFTVIGRKAGLMIDTFRVPTWVLATIVLVGFVVYLAKRTPWLADLGRRIPTLSAGITSFVVLATLGLALNDSGIVVPGMMLAVAVPALIALLALAPVDEPVDPPAAPDGELVATG